MRKLLFIMAFCLTSTCIAQEWFTSFDVAKRMALAQNKMLFVVWEDSFITPYYIRVNDEKGKSLLIDVTQNDEVNEIIWKYFVPLVMPESQYGELYNKAKKSNGLEYLSRLEDANIKIMDVNGNILNSKLPPEIIESLESLIEMYALDTAYLNPFLRNYLKKQNFTTTFILASKYLDYAIFSKNEVRAELVSLASTYFTQARNHLIESNMDNKSGFLQKLDLFEIKKLLILNNPKKAKRLLKRIEESEIDKINKSLFVFLNYTTFILLKDEENAALWRQKITQINMKKASLILKATN
jgi:hypothetical protein